MLTLLAIITLGLVAGAAVWVLGRPATSSMCAVTKLSVLPGDILHVRVGMDLGEGLPPWIPGPVELEYVRDDFAQVVPEGVKVLITHCGVEISQHEPPSEVHIARIDEEEKLYGGSD